MAHHCSFQIKSIWPFGDRGYTTWQHRGRHYHYLPTINKYLPESASQPARNLRADYAVDAGVGSPGARRALKLNSSDPEITWTAYILIPTYS